MFFLGGRIMKKLMLLGTFLLMFTGLSSVCSAGTITIQKSSDIASKYNIVEVNVKKTTKDAEGNITKQETLTSGNNNYQSILNSNFTTSFSADQTNQTIEIWAQVGKDVPTTEDSMGYTYYVDAPAHISIPPTNANIMCTVNYNADTDTVSITQ